jgi:hypothetical protein
MILPADKVLKSGLAAGPQVPTVFRHYRERGKAKEETKAPLKAQGYDEETRKLIRSVLRSYRKDPEGFSRKGDF